MLGSVSDPAGAAELPGALRDVVGADLVNANSSLIHICSLCLFGDQDIVVGFNNCVYTQLCILFSLIQGCFSV